MVRTSIFAIVACLTTMQTGFGQHKPRAETIAKSYETNVEKIYDEIDSVGKLLRDESLSMSEAAEIIKQQSALRKKADAIWDSTQDEINKAYKAARDEVITYNDNAKRLEYESAVIGSKIDLLNNVAKNPTKEAFDQNKAKMSADWDKNYGSRLKPFGDEFAKQKEDFFKRYNENYKIDLNKEGYSRIGTSNPYTGEVYYKYYGPDGKLIAAQWKDDAEGWEKAQNDFAASRKRQAELKGQLEEDSKSLTQFEDRFQESRNGTEQKMESLDNQVKKVDFGGSWRGGDNTGNNNRVGLTLNRDGTLTYSWSRAGASYSGKGTWDQAGKRIYAGTNDGKYKLNSSIAEDFRMDFNVSENGGAPFQVFLSR